MLEVPLRPLPNQTVQVQLAGQACSLDVYQLAYGLFVNVWVNNSMIIGGVVAENRNRIVRSRYLGLVGDFIFVDRQGTADPVYTGLGDRFALVYLENDELPAAERS
jgi:hypothetical protein